MKEAVIPDGITAIEESTFSDCTSLTSVTLPDGLETIGDNAFYQCSALSAITFPETLTAIGAKAFMYCSSLESISIPAAVQTMEGSSFGMCEKLANIEMAPDNANYVLVDGVIYNADQTMLLYYPSGKAGTEYVVPDGVKIICPYAFSANRLASITLPESVKIVEEDAIYDCENLTDLIVENPYCRLRGILWRWRDITIHAHSNSRAAAFANSYNMNFVSLGIADVIGDVNGDDVISVSDAVLVLNYYAKKSAGLQPETDSLFENIRLGDIDQDGAITVEDAVSILTYYARKSANLDPFWDEV